jgi:hypothetical protein
VKNKNQERKTTTQSTFSDISHFGEASQSSKQPPNALPSSSFGHGLHVAKVLPMGSQVYNCACSLSLINCNTSDGTGESFLARCFGNCPFVHALCQIGYDVEITTSVHFLATGFPFLFLFKINRSELERTINQVACGSVGVNISESVIGN